MITETTYRSFSYLGCLSQISSRVLKHAMQFIVPAMLCIFIPLNTRAQYKTVESYLNHFTPIAIRLSKSTGIPASVILGVAIIESGHGNSKNCKLLKNHFGIVGKNNLASKKNTYRSMYKSYSSDEASYRHFCKVIKRKSYYAKLKGKSNYKLWLQKINAGYYSSAKMVWVHRIAIAIDTHHLYRLDVDKKYIVAR